MMFFAASHGAIDGIYIVASMLWWVKDIILAFAPEVLLAMVGSPWLALGLTIALVTLVTVALVANIYTEWKMQKTHQALREQQADITQELENTNTFHNQLCLKSGHRPRQRSTDTKTRQSSDNCPLETAASAWKKSRAVLSGIKNATHVIRIITLIATFAIGGVLIGTGFGVAAGIAAMAFGVLYAGVLIVKARKESERKNEMKTLEINIQDDSSHIENLKGRNEIILENLADKALAADKVAIEDMMNKVTPTPKARVANDNEIDQEPRLQRSASFHSFG